MARITDWFSAPADASPRTVRMAGIRSVLLGSVFAALGFVIALHESRWFHGALFSRGGVRVAFVLLVLGSYVPALVGGYRAVFGIARGADADASGGGKRALQSLYVITAMLAFFAGAIAILGATAPDAGPDIASPGRDVRLPGPNERSVTYSVGNDASITIERIVRDAAAPR